MSLRWAGGDNNYCYLVIPLFAYLLWDKRHKEAKGKGLKAQGDRNKRLEDQKLRRSDNKHVEGFRFGEFSWSIFGVIPLLFSIGIIFVGELGSVETLLYIGIWGCVVGLVMVLYGWRIRYLIFPLIILAFIAPLPPFVNCMLAFLLKLAASYVATTILIAKLALQ
jgi:hypothetical protein